MNFKNKKITIDSMIMIYILENHPKYSTKIQKTLKEASEIVISSLLYGEVLTGLYKTQDIKAIEKFSFFIEYSENINFWPFDKETSTMFAKIRSKYSKIKAPDAIHIATAICSKSDLFLTNDKELMHLQELKVINLEKI